MNIFKSLSNGNGAINEVHVSSFLGYLLDPKQDHGLKSEFLKRFINIEVKEEQGDSYNCTFRPSLNYDLANLEYEVKAKCNNDKNRFIDIIIEIDGAVIAIENKIDKEAVEIAQLVDEYRGIRKDHNTKKIHFIFLVPEITKKIMTTFKNLKKEQQEDDTASIVLWEQIYNILSEILKDESEGIINPIDNYLKEIIKSFLAYCNTKTIKDSAPFEINGKKFDLIRYSNGQSDIFEYEDNKWQKIKDPKKSILKKYFDSENIQIKSNSDKPTDNPTTGQYIDRFFKHVEESLKK